MKSPSPFGLKTEALLAMSGLDYKAKAASPLKSPKGKLPFLEDNGRLIADSSLIQRYLEEEKDVDFDSHLDMRQRAVAEAFRRMVEEHLYFVAVYMRWIDNTQTVRDLFLAEAPVMVRLFVLPMIVRKIRRDLVGQGIGRHDRDEIYRFGCNDIKAVSDAMDGPYFFGERPSSLDATLYGILENLVTVEIDNPLRDAVLADERLMTFLEAFRANVFDGRA